jgi:hypothetical protein
MNTKAALLPDRTVMEVAGDDRVSFLQGLVTNDVAGLGEGEARFAGLLSPQGKILFDFFIIPHGETLLLDCASAVSADLAKRLAMYRLRAKVAISDASDRLHAGAAWGDGAEQWAKANAIVAYPDPRLPALGWRLLFRAGESSGFATSTGDYDEMRISLAVPEGGKDYAYGDEFPHEACFDLLHGVNFTKGCYVGQEVVSRMQHRGTARTRVLAATANQPLPQSGSDILADGFAVGRLGSVAGGHGIALARLDRVRDALAKGHAFTAKDIPVHLAAPAWAAYSLDAEPAGAAS